MAYGMDLLICLLSMYRPLVQYLLKSLAFFLFSFFFLRLTLNFVSFCMHMSVGACGSLAVDSLELK